MKCPCRHAKERNNSNVPIIHSIDHIRNARYCMHYYTWEQFTKKLESDIDKCVGNKRKWKTTNNNDIDLKSIF